MKLAFIINALTEGGAQRVIQTLSDWYVKQGIEVFIILIDNENNIFDINKQVKIITLNSSKYSTGIFKLLLIPFQSIELNKILNNLKIDFAISFLVRSNLIYSFTHFLGRKNIIISERNNTYIQYKNNLFMRYLIKYLYRYADKIITISDGLRYSLTKNYRLNNQIFTIYNPQNINLIRELSKEAIEYKFDKRNIYFINIGRLIPLKNHIVLIKAFQKLHYKYPNSKLIILGDGYLRKDLEKLVKSLNMEKDIDLLGFVKNPFPYLKNSDIFILSSIHEGFGNVIVEAMACGLPIISTKCPSGPSEILDNGKYGKLVEVNNIEDLYKKMLEFMDKEERKKYKQLSLQRCQDFDVKYVANRYLNIIKGY